MNHQQLPDSDIWFVRAGRKGVYSKRFLDNNMVAIGLGEIGAIRSTDSDDHIKDCIDSTYPDAKPGSRLSWAGQIIRFVKELSVGDAVVTYSWETRLYHVGKISSVSEPLSSNVEGEELHEFMRHVDWNYQVPRDALSLGTRYSLGSAMTLFKPSSAASRELIAYPERNDGNVPVDDPANEPIAESDQGNIFEDYIDKAEQFVEDKIAGLGWSQMQELVAGILRAMGYRTKVAGPGPDRGVDIFASPDGLGLGEPRIFVEVKHRSDSVGAEQIRSFIGGRKQGDRCLYVSTGGFSREARYEADRSQVPVTLLAMPDLRGLLLDHYEIVDSETRALVPLKKVYWPIAE